MQEELIVQGLSWCVYHGTPIVSLRPASADWSFWITFSTADAEALATDPATANQAAARAYQLLDTINQWLDVEVHEVAITLDSGGALRAEIRLRQGSGNSLTVVGSVPEGIMLAWRSLCPLRTDKPTLDHIKHSLGLTGGSSTRKHPVTDVHLTAPFREFIESLDFDDPQLPDTH